MGVFMLTPVPNVYGYAFQLRPPKRGGQMNKGKKHVLSNVDEATAQHGPRPYADRRQRQLQTLVRRRSRTQRPR
jgi:hypothetical protein